MTGSWSNVKSKHARLELLFKDGFKLYYNDIRNFGTFQVKTREQLKQKIKSIGDDMLSNPPSSTDFLNKLRKYNNKEICEVLMNQKLFSGIGNYIKAESLWYSRIYPLARVKDLTDLNLETLYKAIIFVINKSYREQGATIKDYYTFDGDSGNATNGFVVYGRKLDYNNMTVLKTKTADKRTTHWVVERQVYGKRKETL